MLAATAAEIDTGGGIVVDVSHEEFIDSTGLTAIIAARDQLCSTGHDLILHSLSPSVTAHGRPVRRDRPGRSGRQDPPAPGA